jgi:hypothetical protein
METWEIYYYLGDMIYQNHSLSHPKDLDLDILKFVLGWYVIYFQLF